ncbi:hypothetical protein SDRG_01735 [Saprolegnia diclina VS20]|uniref:Uncharacterized protein n=1 Tax=Saprolegnia diclina (strain VS20) TaxID=1156394 RepID=T0SCS0_SAPDV|nr:hypothetical protein SDRG_01735 [Saprolegnia diclina VS20]EQC40657.1 hypothetical protein SDRG_01735 [Saprolegnia diclina VS20]|eukprot:XP_008605501.1 hypothetical protein SDRG_01735 [Saprolegnia diclina VS20]
MTVHMSYVGRKVRAVKFLHGAKGAACLEGDDYASPLVVAGSYDSQENALTVLFPQMPTSDQMDLADEFHASSKTEIVELCSLKHEGDVTSLGFLSLNNSDFVISGSSNGSIYCTNIVKADPSLALKHVAIPQWENLTAGSITSLDVDTTTASIVASSECGQAAWANLNRLDDIRVIDVDGWAIHDVKMLGVDTYIAMAGSNPSGQLQLWDLKTNANFPIATCADGNGAFTSLATHPTRPELLLTGSHDGWLSIWDRRMLANGAVRSERKHKKPIRSIQCHPSAPRFIYTASDDNTVNVWDFHASKKPTDKIEYQTHARVDGLVVEPLIRGCAAWNTLDVDGDSDTLIAGSDNHSISLVENVSKRINH